MRFGSAIQSFLKPLRPQARQAAGYVLLLRRSRWGLPDGQARQVEAIWHDQAGDRRGSADQTCQEISSRHLRLYRKHAETAEGSARLVRATCQTGCGEGHAVALDDAA